MPSQNQRFAEELARLRREEKRQRREAREQQFFAELPHKIALLSEEGIRVRMLNGGFQIQLSQEGRLANYYPRTGSYFVQKPKLGKTETLSFTKAVEEFRHLPRR